MCMHETTYISWLALNEYVMSLMSRMDLCLKMHFCTFVLSDVLGNSSLTYSLPPPFIGLTPHCQ